MNRKAIVSFSVGLMLGIGGIVAASYVSNLLSGTITVNSSLVLTGTLPTSYESGIIQTSSFFIQNTGNTGLGVHLEFRLSKAGVIASDITVMIIGEAVIPICDSSSCIFTSSSFTILSGLTVQADIGITFAIGGEYVWQLRAIGA
mgnify:FL=1